MEYGFNVKRRKGLEDGDVGDSVNYTTLLDELERLDEMASTTTDPETFSVLVRQVDLIRQQILGFIILQQQQQTKPKLWRFFWVCFFWDINARWYNDGFESAMDGSDPDRLNEY